jgi:hypothetical protein
MSPFSQTLTFLTSLSPNEVCEQVQQIVRPIERPEDEVSPFCGEVSEEGLRFEPVAHDELIRVEGELEQHRHGHTRVTLTLRFSRMIYLGPMTCLLVLGGAVAGSSPASPIAPWPTGMLLVVGMVMLMTHFQLSLHHRRMTHWSTVLQHELSKLLRTDAELGPYR